MLEEFDYASSDTYKRGEPVNIPELEEEFLNDI